MSGKSWRAIEGDLNWVRETGSGDLRHVGLSQDAIVYVRVLRVLLNARTYQI